MLSENAGDQAIYDMTPDPVLYKVTYTPPYECFTGIKGIQLAVRKHDVFEKQGVVVAIEFTEYLGHETEEFFVTTLRFLSDMSSKWEYIFVIRGGSSETIRRMYAAARCYMNGKLIQNCCCREIKDISRQLHDCSFDSAASDCLAEVLFAEEFSCCRSAVFYNDIASEILSDTGGSVVSVADLMDYVRKEGNSLEIIGGQRAVNSICTFRRREEIGYV